MTLLPAALGTDELLTSFDGLILFRPPTRAWRTTGPWLHTDQAPPPASDTAEPGVPDWQRAPGSFEREYVQGFVSLVPTTAHSGGNVVVPKSHLEFEGWARSRAEEEWGRERTARHERMLAERAICARLDPGDLTRARSHCRFVPPLIHCAPYSLTYLVPLFLSRQCDRT
jgi:hypothetical protein